MLREQTALLHGTIGEFGEEELLIRPAEDAIADLVGAYRLDVPVLHRERTVVAERGEAAPGAVRVVFAVPFDGAPGMFDVKPSNILMVPWPAAARDGELRITVQQQNASKESIERELTKWLDRYEEALSTLRADVASWNERLPAAAAELVNARKQQLLRARDVVASLDFPVRKREDAVIPVAVSRRVHIAEKPRATKDRFAPEYELPERDYEEILAAMRSMGIVMERAPGTFSGLTEEGVRDFFLAVLNVGFRGDAMAEVFNGEGKTDILIRVGERNVFIAEFKVWGGEKELSQAVDQLLRNLGWRDTKCALVLLVRQRAVTGILNKADHTLRDHKCFKRTAPHRGGELERRYVFHWPGDDKRELVLSLQVFPVPDAPGRRQRRRPRVTEAE